MLEKEIEREFRRRPFTPMRFHLTNGKKLEAPFKGVAVMLDDGVLVFKGVKEGRREAKGFDVVAFDKIDRIERKSRKNGKPGERE